MEERVFLNQSTQPTEQVLQLVLGNAYTYYQKIINLAGSFSQDWSFSKTSGWVLKVYDKKKALFYLIPLKNEFKISMAIRENEKNAFLEDDQFKMIHPMLVAAKKYVEGFALQFLVSNENEYKTVELFMEKLIGFRSTISR